MNIFIIIKKLYEKKGIIKITNIINQPLDYKEITN